MPSSAWWGQSFVAELHRISEQAEKKLKVRKGSSVDFAERPTEITSENASAAPADGDKAPEKSALKRTILLDKPVSESPSGTPMQSIEKLPQFDQAQVNGADSKDANDLEVNKSSTI